jgi:hypothetical protein
MKQFKVIRTVQEFYWVEAKSKREALQLVGEIGNPSEVTIKSEKAIEIHTTLRIGQNVK